ncbi:MAG TPA: hypothetical protein VGF25_20325 [Thermoleophilaceae bacterium]
MENALARTTCPSCGAAITTAGRACSACGFAVLEADRRPLPRPPPRTVAILAGTAAAAGAAWLIATREPPPQTPPIPRPLTVQEAERRLELRLTSNTDDDTAAVTCASRLRYGTAISCQVRYTLGGVQPIIVRLTRDGSVDWDIPALR